MIEAASRLISELGRAESDDQLAAALRGSGVEPSRIAEAIITGLELAPRSVAKDPSIALATGAGGLLASLGGSFGIFGMQQVLGAPRLFFLIPLLPLPWLVLGIVRALRRRNHAPASVPFVLLCLRAAGIAEELALLVAARVAGLDPSEAERGLEPGGTLVERAARTLDDQQQESEAFRPYPTAMPTAAVIGGFWIAYALCFERAVTTLVAP